VIALNCHIHGTENLKGTGLLLSDFLIFNLTLMSMHDI